MICPTCNGKGLLFKSVLVGEQYEVLPHPCPDCHAGCQHCCDGDIAQVEDDGFITVYSSTEKCK